MCFDTEYFLSEKTLKLRNKEIAAKNPCFVMGIVNADEDSFWKESRGGLELALKHIEEGADLIDIGAESTRPGAEYISAEEEIRRLIPVIEGIRKVSDIPVSIDTRKASVMKAAFEAGADILNDVSALEDDEDLADFCASVEIPVILMHKRGIPVIMQNDVEYSNIFSEVSSYLEERASYAMQKGISRDKIIVDPGIGFGKDLKGNMILISKAGKLCGRKFPVLMALSRKSCIGEITGEPVEGRLTGTVSADIFSALSGCFMIRVHDVKAHVEALNVMREILNAGN